MTDRQFVAHARETEDGDWYIVVDGVGAIEECSRDSVSASARNMVLRHLTMCGEPTDAVHVTVDWLPRRAELALRNLERAEKVVDHAISEIAKLLELGRAERYFSEPVARRAVDLRTFLESFSEHIADASMAASIELDAARQDAVALGYWFVPVDDVVHLYLPTGDDSPPVLCRANLPDAVRHGEDLWPGGTLCRDCAYELAHDVLPIPTEDLPQ